MISHFVLTTQRDIIIFSTVLTLIIFTKCRDEAPYVDLSLLKLDIWSSAVIRLL